MRARRAAILCGAVVCLLVAQMASRGQTPLRKNESNKPAPSAAEAEKYFGNVETELLDLGVKASRASWVEENFITEDTEKISAGANEVLNTASTKHAKEAHRFDGLKLEPELARRRLLLELAAGFPAPNDPKAQKELGHPGVARWRLGKGKVAPGWGKGRVPGRYGGETDGRKPRPRGAEARLGGMACDWRADAAAVSADGGAGKRGRTGARAH